MRIYVDSDLAFSNIQSIVDSIKSDCISGCANCASPTLCSACKAGYFLNNSSQLCFRCQGVCEKCNDADTCTRCIEGWFLYLNQCNTYCPDIGFWPDKSTRECEVCQMKCLKCSSGTQCTVCAATYFTIVQDNVLDCVTYCPEGYYADYAEYRCVICYPLCQTCPNGDECTTCKSDFFELRQETVQCLYKCPFGYFMSGHTCQPCDITCDGCNGPTGAHCTKCKKGYNMINGFCDVCPIMMYYNTDTCQPCHETCASCIAYPGCETCGQGLVLNYRGICVDLICDPGTYKHKTSCWVCPIPCLTCDSETLCTKCATGSYLKDGACVCEDIYLASNEGCRLKYTVTSTDNAVLLLKFSNYITKTLLVSQIFIETTAELTYKLTSSGQDMGYFVYLQFNPVPVDLVTLSFSLDPITVKDVKGIFIDKKVTQLSLDFRQPDTTSLTLQELNSAKKNSSAASGSSTAAVLTGSNLSGNPSAFFTLLNSLQFFSLLSMIDCGISPEVRGILVGANPLDSVPNVIDLFVDPNWFNKPHKEAEDCGYDTAGFLYNIGQVLTVHLVLSTLHLSIYILSKILICWSSLRIIFENILLTFKSSVYVSFFFGTFQEILVDAFIQIRAYNYENLATFISLSVAVAVASLYCILPFVLGWVLIKNIPDFKNSSGKVYRSLQVVIDDLKKEPSSLISLSLFMLHRIACSSIIVFLSMPLMQLSMCLGLTVAVI